MRFAARQLFSLRSSIVPGWIAIDGVRGDGRCCGCGVIHWLSPPGSDQRRVIADPEQVSQDWVADGLIADPIPFLFYAMLTIIWPNDEILSPACRLFGPPDSPTCLDDNGRPEPRRAERLSVSDQERAHRYAKRGRFSCDDSIEFREYGCWQGERLPSRGRVAFRGP